MGYIRREGNSAEVKNACKDFNSLLYKTYNFGSIINTAQGDDVEKINERPAKYFFSYPARKKKSKVLFEIEEVNRRIGNTGLQEKYAANPFPTKIITYLYG